MSSRTIWLGVLTALLISSAPVASAQSGRGLDTTPDAGTPAPGDGRPAGPTGADPFPQPPRRADSDQGIELIERAPAPTAMTADCAQDTDLELRIKACSDIITHPDTAEPLIGEAYLNRAVAFYRQEKYFDAVDDFNEVMEILPLTAELLDYRGNSHAYNRDLYRAMEDHNMAVEMDPLFASARNSRAADHIQRENLSAAMTDLDEALRLAPDYRNAIVNRIFVRCRLGLMGGTLDDVERAVAMGAIQVGEVHQLLERMGRLNGVGTIDFGDLVGEPTRLRVKRYCQPRPGGLATRGPVTDSVDLYKPRRGP